MKAQRLFIWTALLLVTLSGAPSVSNAAMSNHSKMIQERNRKRMIEKRKAEDNANANAGATPVDERNRRANAPATDAPDQRDRKENAPATDTPDQRDRRDKKAQVPPVPVILDPGKDPRNTRPPVPPIVVHDPNQDTKGNTNNDGHGQDQTQVPPIVRHDPKQDGKHTVDRDSDGRDDRTQIIDDGGKATSDFDNALAAVNDVCKKYKNNWFQKLFKSGSVEKRDAVMHDACVRLETAKAWRTNVFAPERQRLLTDLSNPSANQALVSAQLRNLDSELYKKALEVNEPISELRKELVRLENRKWRDRPKKQHEITMLIDGLEHYRRQFLDIDRDALKNDQIAIQGMVDQLKQAATSELPADPGVSIPEATTVAGAPDVSIDFAREEAPAENTESAATAISEETSDAAVSDASPAELAPAEVATADSTSAQAAAALVADQKMQRAREIALTGTEGLGDSIVDSLVTANKSDFSKIETLGKDGNKISLGDVIAHWSIDKLVPGNEACLALLDPACQLEESIQAMGTATEAAPLSTPMAATENGSESFQVIGRREDGVMIIRKVSNSGRAE